MIQESGTSSGLSELGSPDAPDQSGFPPPQIMHNYGKAKLKNYDVSTSLSEFDIHFYLNSCTVQIHLPDYRYHPSSAYNSGALTSAPSAHSPIRLPGVTSENRVKFFIKAVVDEKKRWTCRD
jgi:hypothetical protein